MVGQGIINPKRVTGLIYPYLVDQAVEHGIGCVDLVRMSVWSKELSTVQLHRSLIIPLIPSTTRAPVRTW